MTTCACPTCSATTPGQPCFGCGHVHDDPFTEWPPEVHETEVEREEREWAGAPALGSAPRGTAMTNPFVSVDKLMAFEQGELGPSATLDLFSDLVRSGLAWRLQGVYGRTATALIEEGLLTEDGELTDPWTDTEID